MSDSLADASLEELLELVDLNRDFILVGFLEHSREQRRAVREGATQHEHRNLDYARGAFGAAGAESGGGAGGLASCAPLLSLMISMVRGYTSKLRWHHCEIAFLLRTDRLDDPRRQLLAVAVRNGRVFINAREFHKEYHWVYVAIDCASLVAMLTLAVALRGEQFSMESASRSALTPGPEESTERQGLFCSQLAAKLLSVLPHASAQLRRPNTQTVDDIFELVTQSEFAPPTAVNYLVRARLHEHDTLSRDAARSLLGAAFDV